MRLSLLLLSAASLALSLGCTCDDLRPHQTPVPHAEAILSLTSASEEARLAVLQALAAEGSFGVAEGSTPLPCVTRITWPLQGDDAERLVVDTHHTEGCDSPPVSRHAELHRVLRTRPDTRPHPGRGFRAPRLAFQQRWIGLGWAQQYQTFGRMDLDLDTPISDAWVRDLLPPPIEHTAEGRELRIRSWTYPPWVFGRSTYRIRLEEHTCAHGGEPAVSLTLSRHGDRNAYIPKPSQEAIERVAEALDAFIYRGLPPAPSTRCAPPSEATP